MLKKTARDRTKVLFRAVFFCFLEKPIFYWTNPLLKSEFVQFFKEKKLALEINVPTSIGTMLGLSQMTTFFVL